METEHREQRTENRGKIKVRYWDKKIETMPVRKLRMLQEKRLKRMINYVAKNSILYKKKFNDYGIEPRDIKTFEDFLKIPPTDKDDLRPLYPWGALAIPLKNIIQINTTSGTTGNPVTIGWTKKDFQTFIEVEARQLTASDIREDDIMQVCMGFGMWTGGLGYSLGGRRIGATVIPAGTGNTERQLTFLSDFKTTVLICTPTYAMYLVEKAIEKGVDIKKDWSLRMAHLGGEPFSESTRKRLEEILPEGCKVFDHYGIVDPWVGLHAAECIYRDGLHTVSDIYYMEVVNPETFKPVAPKEIGELLITNLVREGTPVLRFRTSNLTYIYKDKPKCPCGRTHFRIARIQGRTDDRLKIRGQLIFPSQIEDILIKIPELSSEYQIVIDRKAMEMEELTVKAELVPKAWEDEELKERLRVLVVDRIRAGLSIRVNVEFVPPNSLPRYEGKAKRVFDYREL